MAGLEVNPRLALRLTSEVNPDLSTYSIRTLAELLWIISSRKRELSMSRTRLEPTVDEMSVLEATMISPEPSLLARYSLMELKAPRLWFEGLLASILAEAILTSLIFELVRLPNSWSILLAGLTA